MKTCTVYLPEVGDSVYFPETEESLTIAYVESPFFITLESGTSINWNSIDWDDGAKVWVK